MARWFHRCALVAGLAVLTPASVMAQPLRPVVGFQVGMNLAKVKYSAPDLVQSSDVRNNFLVGFVAGGTIAFPLDADGNFALQSGLFIQAKGGDTKLIHFAVDEEGNSSTYEGTWKLTYVTIPVLAKASFGTGDARPYLMAGPELDILLSAKREDWWDWQVSSQAEKDIKNDMHPYDFGITLGAGVEWLLGETTAYAELAYTHGLLDVLRVEDAVYNVELKNQTIALSVGLKI